MKTTIDLSEMSPERLELIAGFVKAVAEIDEPQILQVGLPCENIHAVFQGRVADPLVNLFWEILLKTEKG